VEGRRLWRPIVLGPEKARPSKALWIQRVDFDDRNTGTVIHAADDGGVLGTVRGQCATIADSESFVGGMV